MSDSLGDRMKSYEVTTRLALPRRTLAVIRIDGRAFHSWTRGLERPFSVRLTEAMAATALAVCEEVSGAVFGYTQSDEISILVQDFAKADTQPWFGGAVQKVCSVASSVATAYFARTFPDRVPAFFDARVFPLPSHVEALNYLVWRQRDAQRNAVSMLAEHHFSSKSLHGLSTAERRSRLAEHGVEVESHDPRFLHGQSLHRETIRERVRFFDQRRGLWSETSEPVERRRWVTQPAPEFGAIPDNWLWGLIPDPAGEQRDVEA